MLPMNRFSFYAIALFAAVLAIAACQQPGASSASAPNASTPSVAIAKRSSAKCKTPDCKIPKDSAVAQINRWLALRDRMLKNGSTPADSFILIKYFNIPPPEFQDMLNDLGKDPNVKAEFAIQYDTTGKKPKPYLGLIFKGKKKKGADVVEEDDYYDFVDPCPTNCD